VELVADPVFADEEDGEALPDALVDPVVAVAELVVPMKGTDALLVEAEDTELEDCRLLPEAEVVLPETELDDEI
jgi:hypothetical protein